MNKSYSIGFALALAFGASLVATILLVLGMVAYGITRQQSVDLPWIATYLDTPLGLSFQLSAYVPLFVLALAAAFFALFYWGLRKRAGAHG